MVEIAEIVDRDSFEAWLKQEDLPREAMVALAVRSAARVFPLWWAEFGLQNGSGRRAVFGLASLWSLLAAVLFALRRSERVVQRLRIVAEALDSFSGEPEPVAAHAAFLAADAIVALPPIEYTTEAISAAVDACDSVLFHTDVAHVSVWSGLRSDCEEVADIDSLFSQPLWQESENPFLEIWHHNARNPEGTESNPWAFWLDWYHRLLDGTEDRWDLLTDIALLDKDAAGNDLWKDPDKIAAEIARLEAEYAAKQAPVPPKVEDDPLSEVIAATPNAERVEYAPEKEAIHTVPLSDLPVDHLQDALDRLTDASEVFGPPDRFRDQYTALIPDIDKLRRALARYANRPLRLHDVAADLSARLDNRIRNGECPETEKDALVASYKADLAGAMVDLQAHDPRVIEAVKARLAHGVDKVDEADQDAFVAGVEAAAQITDEVLRAELRADLETIRDPHAEPEESRQAIYRLGSRLPRILWVFRKEAFIGFTGMTAVGTGLEWSVTTIIRLFMGGG